MAGQRQPYLHRRCNTRAFLRNALILTLLYSHCRHISAGANPISSHAHRRSDFSPKGCASEGDSLQRPLEFSQFQLAQVDITSTKRSKRHRRKVSSVGTGVAGKGLSAGVVLVVCHGFLDRLSPLVLVAQELASRGFHVVVATHEDARRWVPEGSSLRVESLGSVGFEDERVHSVFDRVGMQTSFGLGVRQLLSDLFLATAEEVFKSVTALIQRVGPGHILTDELAFGVLEAAEAHGIGCTVNSPTNILNFLGLRGDTQLPEMGSGYGKRMGLWKRSYNTFMPLLTKNTLYPFTSRLEAFGQKVRGRRSNTGYLALLGQANVLVNTAIGFECPFYAPPNVEYTGPIVPRKKWKRGGEDELNLADSFYGCEEKQVLLVYFGHWGHFNEMKERVLNGLSAFCIVLVTPPIPEDSSVAKIVNYEADRITVLDADETSVWEVLGDSVVKLAVSHCDLGFAQQAILRQKPLICIPLYGDQLDVAARVVDAGVGVVIPKTKSTLEARLERKTRLVLSSYNGFQYNCSRMASFLIVNGDGVLRAADAVQEAVFNGNVSRRFYVAASGRDTIDMVICVLVLVTLYSMGLLFSCLLLTHSRQIKWF